MKLRPSRERGRGRHGWLDSHHTFSFAGYYDPAHMGFRALRVINDDRVVGGAGFPPHGHRDMEIVSYVVEGALEHEDSQGNGSVIRPGDVQRMSAGRGIRHSEYNHSPTAAVRFLQIWIEPRERGLVPGYEQQHVGDARKGRLALIASPEGGEDGDGAVRIHQDTRIYASLLSAGESVEHRLAPDRHAWLQVVRGELTLSDATGGDLELREGDGVAFEAPHTSPISIAAASDAELLLFDLA